MVLRPGYITPQMLSKVLGKEVIVDPGIIAADDTRKPKAPGMKYKHYAPKADVTLLDGTFEQFKAYVDAHADQNPSCLCFTGEAEKLGWPAWSMAGRATVPIRQSISSAACAHWMSRGTAWSMPAAEKDGLSMAVYNRLIRAAAFRVIQL